MKVSEPDMAAVVRQFSVNLYFLRRVKVKCHPVQSLSDSFPLWECLKLYKFSAADGLNANSYLQPNCRPVLCLKKIILKTTNVMLS